MVFEILSDNGLNQYYDIEKKPGTRPTEAGNKYQFLENEEIAEEFYDFKSDSQCRVTLFCLKFTAAPVFGYWKI